MIKRSLGEPVKKIIKKNDGLLLLLESGSVKLLTDKLMDIPLGEKVNEIICISSMTALLTDKSVYYIGKLNTSIIIKISELMKSEDVQFIKTHITKIDSKVILTQEVRSIKTVELN